MNFDKRINQKLRDINVTPQEVFTSGPFNHYLRSLLSYPCRSIHRKLPPIQIGWEPESDDVAFTDDKRIYINAASDVVEWAGSKLRKVRIIIGLMVHEYGHIRFTDFARVREVYDAMMRGTLFSAVLLDDCSQEIKDNFEDYKAYVKASPMKLRMAIEKWQDLHNICEDGYIEECLYHSVSGILLDSLNYLRRLQKTDARDLDTMLHWDGYKEDKVAAVIAVYSNLLLTFMKYGVVKCNRSSEEEMKSLPMQYMVKTLPLAQALFTESSGYMRCHLVDQLFLTLWPLYKEYLSENVSSEELMDMLKDALGKMTSQSPSMGASGGNGSPAPLTEKEKDSSTSPAAKRQKRTVKQIATMAQPEKADANGDDKDNKRAENSSSEDNERGDAADGNDGDESPNTGNTESEEGNEAQDGSATDKNGDKTSDSGAKSQGDASSTSAKGGKTNSDGENGDEDNSSPTNSAEPDGQRGSGIGRRTVKRDVLRAVVVPCTGADSETKRTRAEDPIHPDMFGLDSELIAGEEGDIEEDNIEEEIDDETLMSALAVIEKEVATEQAIDLVNEDLNASLQREVDDTDFGAIHRNMSALVRRVGKVSPETKELYERTAKEIQALAKVMARKVAPYLKKKDDMANMPLTGFFSGQRFDATRLALNDLRNFRMNTSPMPDTRVAVSILVDESGSMGGTRIKSALNAALTLYLFCEECDIRCAVTGHTAETRGRGSVDLNVYADFDTPDRDDKYRLLNIQARNCNRDGAALMFAGNHLLKAEEPIKILFVISDGTPNAYGYHDRPAEMDLTEIAAGLRRQGVVLFTLAIGDDRDSIHRIYGDSFIDISDINTLPDQLVQLVKRYIR